MAKAIHARGGEKRLRAVQSQHLEMEITFLPGNSQGSLVVDIKRPGKLRQELTLGGKTYLQVLDGGTGWATVLPGPSPIRELSADEVKNLRGPADLDGPLMDAKSKGNQVEFVARERVGDADAYKLKVTGKDGTVRYDYLDARTFLEIKWEGTVMAGKPVITESFFGDFRKVNGVMLPFRIDSDTEGTLQRQAIVVHKLILNQVPDSAFQRPSK